ncbi:TetR/AcrR family transcriptional regulator [Haloarcula japonica]|uniref:DNA binding protein putative transcriptional regulator n=1 Tax=Haloarcula japonica (strain ATCC 49778 / DSM 6131 / JCM 7785 / NBRC 101032 / NCIMB 13157 / TR-1) TaxID=1227453 RepID=M0L6F2_HALJT|nr:TetR/AcrR family transcriptional regulator [Haloarcula japonica]EMA28708.1 DNA binding protein putative transcriptional regulator [Haloarcula japonica DSM 6131]
MSDGIPFAGEPADSHEAIMRATFRALREYGYAGLSIQRIADEADLSKSTFYHHFDGKEDLLLSFQEFILTEFNRIFQIESTGDPEQDIKTFVSLILDDFPDCVETPDKNAVLGSYVEMRAQAVQNPDFREKFTETDKLFARQFAQIIEDGIEQGVFADVDPETVSQFMITILDGVILQNATRNDDPVSTVRDTIDEYIEETLLLDA